MGGNGDGARAVGRKPALKLVGEQQIGQLRPAVRGNSVEGPLHIVEVGRGSYAMSEAADRDHARAVNRQHAFEKQAGEREVAEMICAELKLDTVRG